MSPGVVYGWPHDSRAATSDAPTRVARRASLAGVRLTAAAPWSVPREAPEVRQRPAGRPVASPDVAPAPPDLGERGRSPVASGRAHLAPREGLRDPIRTPPTRHRSPRMDAPARLGVPEQVQ